MPYVKKDKVAKVVEKSILPMYLMQGWVEIDKKQYEILNKPAAGNTKRTKK